MGFRVVSEEGIGDVREEKVLIPVTVRLSAETDVVQGRAVDAIAPGIHERPEEQTVHTGILEVSTAVEVVRDTSAVLFAEFE
jgi:hypothetical protein